MEGNKGGLLTEARQLNWVFMDIKKDIIEQNDHVWCNWDLLECQQKKIIKGEAFIISLFLTFVAHLAGWNMYAISLDVGQVGRYR